MSTNQPAASTGRISLRLQARDFSRDWRRYNLVANYVAEYASYFFAHKDRAENVISSVLYELLEYIVGMSLDDSELALGLNMRNGRLVFEVATSGATREGSGQHQELLADLSQGDLDGLYRRMLVSDSEEQGSRGSLGIAMLAHDYGAEFSTSIDPAGAVAMSASIGQDEMNP
jgi:hypothetical protein